MTPGGGPRGLAGFSGLIGNSVGGYNFNSDFGDAGRTPFIPPADGIVEIPQTGYTGGGANGYYSGNPSATIVPRSNPRPNTGGTGITNFASGQPGSDPFGIFGSPVAATSWGYQNPSGSLTTAIPTYWGPSNGQQAGMTAWSSFGGGGGGFGNAGLGGLGQYGVTGGVLSAANGFSNSGGFGAGIGMGGYNLSKKKF